MNEKNVIYTNEISSGTQSQELLPMIPLGDRWVINSFGASDINVGDNKSSVYILMYDTEILCIISLTGNTQEIDINKEIVGDGTKRIKIIRKNTCNTNKAMPCWLKAFKRS